MKRALSFIFIFLIVGSIFTVLPSAHGDEPQLFYRINLFDQLGRQLPSANGTGVYTAIGTQIETHIYKQKRILGIPIPNAWDEITSKKGGTFFVKLPVNQPLRFDIYYYGKLQYSDVIYTDSNEIINITLPFIPAKPIATLRAESLGVSGDLHQINTAHYRIIFGEGDNKNIIRIWLETQHFDIPVQLSMTGEGSETKPFKFLAQSTSGAVEGQEKFLIWETGRYLSAVRTAKVGDNGILIVWTYMYADTLGAWKNTIITAILGGAVLGTFAEPGVGTIAGGLAGGLVAGITYAIKPELVNLSAHTAIGVIAGYFTPRWFILQGAGFGSNGTNGNVNIDFSNIQEGMLIDGNSRYEIYKASNELQIGYTKYTGKGISTFTSTFDNDNWQNEWTHVNGGSITNGYIGKGLKQPDILKSYYLKKGDYTISISYYFKFSSDETAMRLYPHKIQYGGTSVGAEACGYAPHQWTYVSKSYDITLNQDGYVNITIKRSTSGTSHTLYIDEIKITIYDESEMRVIFNNGAKDTIISKFAFNTIAVVSPQHDVLTPIQQRYTLLGIDITKYGYLALDWASPQPENAYYSRIFIRTETWKEDFILLGTDARDGFKNITFLITEPKNFIYSVDFSTQFYPVVPPENTTEVNYDPIIVNNTIVYTLPSDWNGYSIFDEWKYNLNGWWQNIGTWGHLALMGLGLLIIFIILLILAPQIIILLIKLIAWAIRGIIKGIGQIGKAFKGKRRR